MMWLDDAAFHHLSISRVFISKSLVFCSSILCPRAHLTPPYTPRVTPLEKGLQNGPPPIWLKILKMIASFTIRPMVKMAPKIGVVCERYQFPRFYVK
jgi:hypothetical protein